MVSLCLFSFPFSPPLTICLFTCTLSQPHAHKSQLKPDATKRLHPWAQAVCSPSAWPVHLCTSPPHWPSVYHFLKLVVLRNNKISKSSKGPSLSQMAHQSNSKAVSSNTTIVLELYPHWYLTSAKPSCLSYLWINKQPFPPRIAFYPRKGILTPLYTLNAQSHDGRLSCEYSLTFLFLRASNSFIDLHWCLPKGRIHLIFSW